VLGHSPSIITQTPAGLIIDHVIQLSQIERARERFTPMTAKKAPDLETFVKNVNKKDKRNGLKIRFAFVKRKRR